ncbi:hypothetical protein WA1_31585 [Scytonema hofmannii PCC 7110]|uniref:HicB-like antitoxin of toxin-antitoxin system domain-containing protein n=1 Tax=Scytonema hofmannii PCC 7110 TaxID=128403 RepID=A0A139X3U6_9CYAN|nr:HicB family protein [Scytonema hofmannii]KYC39282.1 hypothetical protein WA1_31585 [Scytonema hofmannii PCC 7110]
MELKQNIRAVIHPGEQHGYVAECLEVSVVTQGDTLNEVVHNLREAVALHLEDEDPTQFGLIDKPSLLITFELQPEYA